MTTFITTVRAADEIHARLSDELAAGATSETATLRAVHFGEAAACAALRDGRLDDARTWAYAVEALQACVA